MKKIISVPYWMFLLLFLLVSCQTSEPAKTNSEYVAGKQLAEAYAKKDAKKLGCLLYRRNAWQNKMSSDLRQHTLTLKNEKSEDFMSGFIEGYRKYYAEYADTYCGK
jgi:predicted secreted protein